MEERLQKIISRAGIASRRHAEQLILSGAVSVNGRVVTELGTKADATRDHITVGPRTVRIPEVPERYVAFYKPAQVVSTMNDPEGRPCLGPYLRGFKGRLFPVGRLDFDAAGLLVLTSDGALASDLMRGAALIPQTWRFKVKGRIPAETQHAIQRAAGVRLRLHRDAANAWYEADLAAALSPGTAGSGSRSVNGRPRDRLGQALLRHGVLVEKMLRWSYGGVTLDGLAPGEMRELTGDEVKHLRRAVAGRQGDRRNSIPKVRDEKRKSEERPEKAAMAQAVEQWRTVHPRRSQGGRSIPKLRERPYGRDNQGQPHSGGGQHRKHRGQAG